MAPLIWYFMHPGVTLQTHGLPYQKNITNAKVAPTNITLMLLRCIVCILIIIDMLFATKGTEKLLTYS